MAQIHSLNAKKWRHIYLMRNPILPSVFPTLSLRITSPGNTRPTTLLQPGWRRTQRRREQAWDKSGGECRGRKEDKRGVCLGAHVEINKRLTCKMPDSQRHISTDVCMRLVWRCEKSKPVSSAGTERERDRWG